MESYFIAWWNLENLFDVENSANRPAWLANELKSELEGWKDSVLQDKLTNLASVIKQMNSGRGPDLIGVCEVENEYVLRELVNKLSSLGRNYGIIHHDCKDKRGIDVAFIFDKNKYDFTKNAGTNFFHYEVMKRTGTRDIVQANLTTAKGNELIVIGNHWPSRSGGEYETEPYRMMAGETLSYWMKRIQEIKGKFATVFVMGDFNDEPHNRSLTNYALSTRNNKRVINGKNPYLYNLMWPLMGSRIASYVYNAEPLMIDQFLVSKGIIQKSNTNFSVDEKSLKLEEYPGMVKGNHRVPVRFGRPSSGHNPQGFSDHLPISVVLKEQ